MFNVLLSVDEHGSQLVPELAAEVPTRSNHGISADGRTITYHLRRGVRWHDGMPFTSSDVRFTFGAMVDPSNNVPTRAGFDKVSSIDTPDSYTIVFHLKEAYGPILTRLFADGETSIGILPAHAFRSHHGLATSDFSNHPIGTGPFRFVSWQRDARVTLVANDAYFGGKPHVGRVEVSVVPNDATMLLELRTHEIDWAPWVQPKLYGTIGLQPEVRVISVSPNSYYAICFNTAREPVSSRYLRLAIESAIDVATLRRVAGATDAQPALADLPPTLWVNRGGIRPKRYDVPGSLALLRSGGAVLRGRQLYARDGKPVSLELAVNEAHVEDGEVAVQIQSMLSRIGIEITIRPYSANLMTASAADGGVLRSGRFDMAIVRWIGGPDPDDSAEFSCWAIPPRGYNFSRYCRRAMDDLQRSALRTYEPAARAQIYRRIEALIVSDAPEMFLWYPRRVEAVRADLRGIHPNPETDAAQAQDWSWSSNPRGRR
jgi:peptide/nickel transport system substrate-binding protein